MKYIFFIVFLFILSFKGFAETPTLISPKDSRVGVILGDQVNVRQQPAVASTIVEVVKENDYVKILSWTALRITIGLFTDKWVKIQTKTGKVGFIFGAFLFDIEELYKHPWRKSTGSGRTALARFYKNNIYKQFDFSVESGYGNPSFNPEKIMEVSTPGSFTLSGRKITIKFGNNFSYFYLFKQREKYILLRNLFPIQANIIQQGMGDGSPGIWYQVR